jgi:peptide/nickel transport system substrate-binding protein
MGIDFSEGLLESFDFTEDGDDITTTMVLKPNIKWHFDEGTVDAHDIKFTEIHLEQLGTHPSSKPRFEATNNDAEGSIEVKDDLTAVWTQKRSWLKAAFIYYWANSGGGNGFIMPKDYVDRVGEDGYRKKPVNTGPWQMVEHLSDQRVTLEAVPYKHWRVTPEYDRLVINKVPESATRLAMLLAGQVAISDIAPIQAAQVEKNPNTRTMEQGGGQVRYFLGGLINKEAHPDVYNPDLPWTGEDWTAPDKLKVRLAMDIAIDRDAIVEKVYMGRGEPAVSAFRWGNKGAAWNDPSWTIRPYDPTKAKQLLTEAGYPDGFEMNAWVSELSNGPLNDDTMIAIAGFWEKHLDIRVNLKRAQYNPTVRQNFFTRTFDNHAFTYTDPSAAGHQLNHGCCYTTTAPLAYFEHKVIDDLVASSAGVLDVAKASAISKQMGQWMYDNIVLSGVVKGQLLWGLRNDQVGEWKKNLFHTWLGGVEYLEKP